MSKSPNKINGNIVQFNISPKGPVAVHAVPLDDERGSDHPVYELVMDDRSTLSGKVARINFARHGEPNGAIPETGEFVHTKPRGAKAAKLRVGMELRVVGDMRVSPDGFRVIEAENINGIDIEHPKPSRGH